MNLLFLSISNEEHLQLPNRDAIKRSLLVVTEGAPKNDQCTTEVVFTAFALGT